MTTANQTGWQPRQLSLAPADVLGVILHWQPLPLEIRGLLATLYAHIVITAILPDEATLRRLAGVQDDAEWARVFQATLPHLHQIDGDRLTIPAVARVFAALQRRSEQARCKASRRWQNATAATAATAAIAAIAATAATAAIASNALPVGFSDQPATPPTEPEQFALSPLLSVVCDLPKKTEEGEEAKKGRAKLPRRTFAPPTEQDVLTHMLEIAPEMQVSPEMARKQSQTFMCHFGAAGWYTSNRRRMHDWKCAARGWLIREKKWAAERSTTKSTAATPKTGLRNKVYDDWKSPNSHTTTPTVLL